MGIDKECLLSAYSSNDLLSRVKPEHEIEALPFAYPASSLQASGDVFSRDVVIHGDGSRLLRRKINYDNYITTPYCDHVYTRFCLQMEEKIIDKFFTDSFIAESRSIYTKNSWKITSDIYGEMLAELYKDGIFFYEPYLVVDNETYYRFNQDFSNQREQEILKTMGARILPIKAPIDKRFAILCGQEEIHVVTCGHTYFLNEYSNSYMRNTLSPHKESDLRVYYEIVVLYPSHFVRLEVA